MSWWAIISALGLGVATSISPCPLTTNLLAISFLGRNVGKPGALLRSGVAYTLGAAVAYVAVAAAATWLLSAATVSYILQKYMLKLLGPIMILTGMLLLELIRLPVGRGANTATMQRLSGRGGLVSSAVLGAMLAMSFCPVSAAWFFGSLLPLATTSGSVVVLPLMFGLGFALPVLAMCVLLSAGVQLASRVHAGLGAFEKHFRRILGGAMILVGIGFSLRYVFGVA